MYKRPCAGEWLKVVPIKEFGLTMDSNIYATALSVRLGIKVFMEESTCAVCREKVLDVFGEHVHGCRGKGNGIISRHNEVLRIFGGSFQIC